MDEKNAFDKELNNIDMDLVQQEELEKKRIQMLKDEGQYDEVEQQKEQKKLEADKAVAVQNEIDHSLESKDLLSGLEGLDMEAMLEAQR
jgi:hypothetical protein